MWAAALWASNLQRSLFSPAYFLVNLFSCHRFVVQGSSMEPTLSHGHYLLVSRLSYKRHAPARGDIVLAHDPGQPGTDCIKRIIGLPGEHVRIGDGRVFINDRPIQEPYLQEEISSNAAPMSVWLLDEDEYAVLGDNRNDSRDSRRFGPVSRQHLLGKAWIRYWPREAWGTLPRQTPSLLQ